MKKLLLSLTVIAAVLLGALPGFAAYVGGDYAEIACRTKEGDLVTMYAVQDDGDKTVCTEKYITPGTQVQFFHEETDPEAVAAAGIDTAGKVFAYVNWKTFNGYVDVNDLEPLEDTFNSDNAYLDSFVESYRSFAKDGVPVRKGPSMIYEEIGRIPYGADFDVPAVDSVKNPGYGLTTYNGMTGWVNIYPYSDSHDIAYKVDDRSYFTGSAEVLTNNVYLVDINTADGDKYKKVSGIIPAGTVLKFGYYCCLYDYIAAYTEFGGDSGWLIFDAGVNGENSSHVMPYVYDAAYIGKDTPVYAKRNDLSSATGEKIPAGSLVNINAFYLIDNGDEYYYNLLAEYRGKKVWLRADSESEIGMSQGYYIMSYVENDSVNVYKTADFSKKPSAVLHHGELLTKFCSLKGGGAYWNYINSGDISGLVMQIEGSITDYGFSKRHAVRAGKDGKSVFGVSESFVQPDVQTTASAADEKDEDAVTETRSTAREPAKGRATGIAVPVIAGACAVLVTAAAVTAVTLIKKKKKQ